MPTREIKAIFYTRFHHEKGSRVLHQVPPGSITTPSTRSKSTLPDPLFPFSSITNYLIPSQHFCDRLLTFVVNHHRIIGYPVCIQGAKYSRNEFIFNFALVVGEEVGDWACYGEVVRKLGRLLRGLEEQGGFLSEEEDEAGVWNDDRVMDEGVRGEVEIGGGGKVYALCEMVLEDLNNYAECMIPIDDSNTINLKLFPTRPPPPPISAHQVPLLTISLLSLQSPISSDLTLNRILPYINGVHSISRIAQLADTDLSLTRRAIQHLVYYGCLVLLDVFSFGAIYAPTAEMGGFVVDDEVKDECARYIRQPRLGIGSDAKPSVREKQRESISSSASHTSRTSTTSSTNVTSTSSEDENNSDSDEWTPSHTTLIHLYTSLRQGLTLKSWVLAHLSDLAGIDVRRLITFGIIKGFLYRVHKYAIATTTAGVVPPAPPTSLATSTANLRESSEVATLRVSGGSGGGGGHHASQSNVHAQHPSFSLHRPSVVNQQGQSSNTHKPDAEFGETMGGENALPMLKFLDGMHCFDEICTELSLPEKLVESTVKAMGEGLGAIVQR